MPCFLRRQHCVVPPFQPPRDRWWTGDPQGRQWSKDDCARAPFERRRTTWPESVAPRSCCQAGGLNSRGRKLGLFLTYFLQYIHRSYQEYTRRRIQEQQRCLEVNLIAIATADPVPMEDSDTYDYKALSSDNSAKRGTVGGL